MDRTILGQGAEATVYREKNVVIKVRSPKTYRHPEIDKALRGFRTRREAKVLQKLHTINFPGPRLINVNDSSMEVSMDFLEGRQIKEILSTNPLILSREIGRKVGMLHMHDIIHGDLTTSNMIYTQEIHFIDFGLSFFSSKVEDKAVDLHLLRCALESKHWTVYEQCFAAVLEGYKEANPDYNAVLCRMEQVEARGRNKHFD